MKIGDLMNLTSRKQVGAFQSRARKPAVFGPFHHRLLPALTLLIAANAWSAAPQFNIMDYGARNDGSASATAAIRSAIQAAHAAGGGTVSAEGK